MTIRIGHLYANDLNLYGDRGNIMALRRRAEWRQIATEVIIIGPGDSGAAVVDCDLLFIGGGQDRDQGSIATDLVERKGPALKETVAQGTPLLAVCGGYQLLGRYYRTADGRRLPGVGLFDLYTEAGQGRLIGNIVIESQLLPPERRTIVGFENHGGRTHLGDDVAPLGRVLAGHGNNGEDHQEGAVYRNAVGTYLHGPLLPKNPALTDWLLSRALDPGGERDLEPLDDRFEDRAHEAALALARAEHGR